jgi:acetyltransferase-like isoleucine patch superfamily enzyme
MAYSYKTRLFKIRVKIGNVEIVAECATVIKDYPVFAIVGGNPAKIIGYLN